MTLHTNHLLGVGVIHMKCHPIFKKKVILLSSAALRVSSLKIKRGINTLSEAQLLSFASLLNTYLLPC